MRRLCRTHDLILIASTMALAVPAFADADFVYSNAATQSCLDDGKGLECVGHSAEKCMEDTEGGYSTYGMGGCMSLEADFWDSKLNSAYQSLMAQAKEFDAMAAEDGFTVLSQADTLRDMQRTWISFRDSRCAYEYSLWGGGTGGGPASIACFTQMTAEQALYLQNGGLGN